LEKVPCGAQRPEDCF